MNYEILEADSLPEMKFWRISNVAKLSEPLGLKITDVLIVLKHDGKLYAVLTPDLIVLTSEKDLKSENFRRNLFKIQKEVYLKEQRELLARQRADLAKREIEFNEKVSYYIAEIDELKKQVLEALGK